MSQLIRVSDVKTLEEYADEHGCTLDNVFVTHVKKGPLFLILSKNRGKSVIDRCALSDVVKEQTQKDRYLETENLYYGVCQYDDGEEIPTVFRMEPLDVDFDTSRPQSETAPTRRSRAKSR